MDGSNVQVDDLLEQAKLFLAVYTAEQIILALFQTAVEQEDITALMPSFRAIVDKRDGGLNVSD
jgi:hypothetical protein